jgi:hypothetical protein
MRKNTDWHPARPGRLFMAGAVPTPGHSCLMGKSRGLPSFIHFRLRNLRSRIDMACAASLNSLSLSGWMADYFWHPAFGVAVVFYQTVFFLLGLLHSAPPFARFTATGHHLPSLILCYRLDISFSYLENYLHIHSFSYNKCPMAYFCSFSYLDSRIPLIFCVIYQPL